MASRMIDSIIAKLLSGFVLGIYCCTISAYAETASNRKVLVLLSAADQIPIQPRGTHPTGIYLGELTEPVEAMRSAGYELVFASPGARPPAIDPESNDKFYFGEFGLFPDAEAARIHALGIFEDLQRNDFRQLLSIEKLAKNPQELEQFVGIYIPGGHAPLVDLYKKNALEGPDANQEVGAILAYFHEHNKPTGLLCHAPVILAAAPNDTNGQWLYKGYRVTVIPWWLEMGSGYKPSTNVLDGTPSKVLVDKGAVVVGEYEPPLPLSRHR